jgi:hypothetical protein
MDYHWLVRNLHYGSFNLEYMVPSLAQKASQHKVAVFVGNTWG